MRYDYESKRGVYGEREGGESEEKGEEGYVGKCDRDRLSFQTKKDKGGRQGRVRRETASVS